MTRQSTSGGFPMARGVQLSKELSYEIMARSAAQAQLDKFWADTFLTNAGINSGTSTGYTYRGSANYDVILNSAGTLKDTQSNSASTYNFGDGALTKRGAGVTFVTGSAYTIASFKVKLKVATGSPTGTVTGYLYAADGSHLPTGSALATAGTLNLATITGSFADYTFTFGTPYALSSGVEYCLVLESATDLGIDASNYIHFAASSGAVGAQYVDQKGNTGVWTSGTNDIWFETYTAGAASAVIKSITLTMPSAITSAIVWANTSGGNPTLVRISTDSGSTWTTIATAQLGQIVAVPSGTGVILEVTIEGAVELESWGVAGV